MDCFLTDEQKRLKEKVRKIALERILPKREEYDQSQQFPWDIVRILANSDIFRVFIPKEYGGLGGGVLDLGLVTEEPSSVCGGIAPCFAGTCLGTFSIILFGSEEQKKIPSGYRIRKEAYSFCFD